MIHGADLKRSDGARLLTQLEQVRAVMLDGKWRSHEEIRLEVCRRFGMLWPMTSIARQVRYLRSPEHGGYQVERKRAASRDAGLWVFRVVGVRDDGWLPAGKADRDESQLLLGR